MQTILTEYNEANFAWDNPAYESELQADLNDPNATYYPTGELVFALNQNHTVQYNMNPLDYRLAWKFDILSLAPYFHKILYVDAHTGTIFNEEQLLCSNGSANITGHGSQTIDTRYIGWFQNHHILKSNDGTTNVHTKNYSGGNFNTTAEVSNATTSWGNNHQESTTAHWCVTQTWDYFETIHSRIGIPDQNFGNEVKVLADKEWVTPTTQNGEKNGAWFDYSGGIDRIYAGYFDAAETMYTGELSILAHEYTHGIDQREGKLKYEKESGALDESFADIFGFLTRRYVTNSNNWVIGASNFQNREKRNLQNPSTHGIHYDINTTTNTYNEQPGQPDTYNGTFWFDVNIPTSLDNGGVHVNSGVQNFWFYLLSQGGSDTNDLGDAYSVSGIGYADAAEITYYNFVNNMQRKSKFEDAMEGSIEAAEELFGVCSAQAIATEEAWYAVGLGSGSTCEGAGIKEAKNEFNIFPNPTQNIVQIEFTSSDHRTIEIYNLTGQLLRTYNFNSKIESINLSELSNGIYLIKERGNNSSIQKVIKN
ncbi:M4 family metallopeptidase [Putridiphycobacter roseus]|nr:M4 family metallopeptidase [Putridiphycobacter roseus]